VGSIIPFVVLLHEGELYDLSALVVTGGWFLAWGLDIDDAGHVLAMGENPATGESGFVLLTPR
jgi:hypothetical protein